MPKITTFFQFDIASERHDANLKVESEYEYMYKLRESIKSYTM